MTVANDPVYCVEYFYAKPEYKEDLKKSLLKLVERTRSEPGCLQYDLLQDKENLNLLIIIVKFSNAETMSAHEKQPYIQAFAEKEMNEYCEKVFWNDAIAL